MFCCVLRPVIQPNVTVANAVRKVADTIKDNIIWFQFIVYIFLFYSINHCLFSLLINFFCFMVSGHYSLL